MTNKRFMMLVFVTLSLAFALIVMAQAKPITWERDCFGRVELSKTDGAWLIVCKPGSGIRVIQDDTFDPSPWPRDATTEAIFKATWTPEPYPPVPVYP